VVHLDQDISAQTLNQTCNQTEDSVIYKPAMPIYRKLAVFNVLLEKKKELKVGMKEATCVFQPVGKTWTGWNVLC